MSSEGLHEREENLSPETLDRHRAIASLVEEIEAIDWYDQRIAVTTDRELAQVLAHNRDEEKEHAAMVLEWLRRHDAVLDAELRKYLYSTHRLGHGENDVETTHDEGIEDGSLGIGSLRG